MAILPIASELYQRLCDVVAQQRIIIVAGIPSAGSSVLTAQLTMIARERERPLQLLRYPALAKALAAEHAISLENARGRLLVDRWARDALATWQQQAEARALAIVEAPLVGRRLLSLVEPADDGLEPILTDPTQTVVLVPVPSWDVREQIEALRAPERPHEVENPDETAAEQPPTSMWQEINITARDIALTKANPHTAYNPYIYGGVYERILRHRPNEALVIKALDAEAIPDLAQLPTLMPDAATLQRYADALEVSSDAELQQHVNAWAQPLIDAAPEPERGPELVMPLPKALQEKIEADTLLSELSQVQRQALRSFMQTPIDTPPSAMLPLLDDTLQHFAADYPAVLIETHKHDIYDEYFHVRRSQGDDAASFLYGLLFSYRNAIANLPNVQDGISIIEMPMLRVALDTTLKQFIDS